MVGATGLGESLFFAVICSHNSCAMIRLVASIVVVLSVCLLACTNRDKESLRRIYFDYKVSGEEGNDSVTVLLQFRRGPEGSTVAPEAPVRVELDGQSLRLDSSEMTGPFYEIVRPLQDFTGPHTILFTNKEGEQYKEEFTFRLMTLKTELPPVITRSDLVLELEGLDTLDYVRVLLTDTSFTGMGINRLDTVRNGQVRISRLDLDAVSSGPVYLELSRENEKPVTKATPAGGRLSVTYGLKREFGLKDAE